MGYADYCNLTVMFTVTGLTLLIFGRDISLLLRIFTLQPNFWGISMVKIPTSGSDGTVALEPLLSNTRVQVNSVLSTP